MRRISLTFALVFAAAAAGCGRSGDSGGTGSPGGTGTTGSTSSSTSSTTTAAAPAPAPSPAPAPVPSAAPPPLPSAAPAPAGATVAAGGATSGEAVYAATCVACHGAGVAGAPKLGDKADWGPRIAQGTDVLYQHSIQGFTGKKGGVMPPKGGNTALPDEQVKAAVDYMVSKGK